MLLVFVRFLVTVKRLLMRNVFRRLVGSVGRAPDRRATFVDTSAVGYIMLISMRLSALNKIVREKLLCRYVCPVILHRENRLLSWAVVSAYHR